MKLKTIFFCLIFCMLLLGVFTQVVNACPTCSDSLTQSEAGRRMIDGYFWSIIFMMSMPFAILLGFGGYMYRIVYKARAKEKQESANASSPQDDFQVEDNH